VKILRFVCEIGSQLLGWPIWQLTLVIKARPAWLVSSHIFCTRSRAGCAARTHDCGGAGGDIQPACKLHWRRAAAHDASTAAAEPRHIRRQRREQAADRTAVTAQKQLQDGNCLQAKCGGQQCLSLRSSKLAISCGSCFTAAADRLALPPCFEGLCNASRELTIICGFDCLASCAQTRSFASN